MGLFTSPVGIKNSWKYEKDLTILNLIELPFTIIHKDNILLPNWAIKT